MIVGGAVDNDAFLAAEQMSAIDSSGNSLQNSALQILSQMKEEFGEGSSTLVMIYNATGETLTYCASCDWSGQVGKQPYDLVIYNGQYSVFLHAETSFLEGSIGGVIYRGTRGSDILLTWDNPLIGENRIYIDVQESNYWTLEESWDQVENKLQASSSFSLVQRNGYVLSSSISPVSSPIASYILKRGL